MNENFKVVTEWVDNASKGLTRMIELTKEFTAGVLDGAKAELELANAEKAQGDQADKSSSQTAFLTKAMVVLAAAVYAAKQVVDGLIASVKEADALDDLSDKTGIAAADLKELGYAAKIGGSSLEGLIGAFNKLGRSANASEEDVKKQAQAFKQFGVDVTDANGQVKDSETLFMELADAFKDIEDGPEKSAAAFRIFGSEAKNLTPLLNRGSEGIKALREESAQLGGLSKDAFNAYAKASGDLFDNLDKLSVASKGFFDVLASRLVPVINIVLEQIVESAKEGGMLRDVIDGIAWAFKNGVIPVIKVGAIVLDGFTSVVKIAAKGLGALGAAMVALLNGDFKGVKQVFSDYSDDVNKVAEDHVTFQKRMIAAGHEATNLATNLEKPKRTIKALGKETKETESELQKMLDSLKTANESFGKDDSVKQTLEAQQKYYKDVKVLGQERAAALYAEVDAQIQLNRALREGADAQEKYKKSMETIDAIKAENAELEFEISLVGKSAEERKRLIELRKEELKIQQAQKGLTEEAAGRVAEEGRNALRARDELIKSREEAAATNEILDASYERILADVQRRLILATDLLEKGKISVDDYTKYVDKQMDRLKDGTKKDLDELQVFWQKAGEGIQSVFASAIEDLANGSLKDLDQKIAKVITNVIAQILAAKAAVALFGNDFGKGNVGGFVGQAAGFIGSLFGGARAGGGRVDAGRAYTVGEYGVETFVPSVSGTIIPNGAMQQQAPNVTLNVTAIDTKDLMAKLSTVKRELTSLVGNTKTNYNLSGAY